MACLPLITVVPKLTSQPDFADEDFDPDTLDKDFWNNATATPHRIHGSGGMVYWRDCKKVALAQPTDRGYKEVQQCRRTGRARLLKGLTLFFWGSGGEAKEE
jgi:hypothetical protein